MNFTAIIIAAAGSGLRAGLQLPKQYAALAGMSVLERTLRSAARSLPDARIVLVISPEHKEYLARCVIPADITITDGGATRQASVRAGLEALADAPPHNVLVHDAARPFINADICARLLSALQSGARAAIPALAVADTLKRGDREQVRETIPRDALFSIQTPQAFDYATLLTLHRQATDTRSTDDASLCEAAGIPVALVEGSAMLMKITTQDDLAMAETLARAQLTPRSGYGIDVHRLLPFDAHVPEAQRLMRLGGVAIAHTHYLEGHSDADVVLHALTDAILGALGEGDIGQHFPPSDPQWRGADSARFVAYACTLLRQRGGILTHADLTIVAQQPKIAPHRDAMRQRVAELLGVSPACVNIKATTTEGLGYEGRGEGITAHAIVTVHLPVGVL